MREIRWLQNNLHVFALLSAVILPGICVSMYGLAIYQGHVEPIFPYVSDAASKQPQVNYFQYLTTLIAITISIAGYARYRQVKYYIEQTFPQLKIDSKTKRQLKLLNSLALINLYLSNLGTIIAGHFTSTEHLLIHCTGVILIFMMSAAEASMITICVRLSSAHQIETYPTTMMINFVVQLIAGISGIILALAPIYFGSYVQSTDGSFRLAWSRAQDGYWCHVSSAALEWIALNLNSVYMLCLASRMRQFSHWDRVWSRKVYIKSKMF